MCWRFLMRPGSQTFLNTLLCPTDSPPELITVSGVQFATHNYNLNVGSAYSVLQNPLTPLVGAANGPFFENSNVSPAAFTDGMSNTAAVSETIRSTSSSTYLTDPVGVFLVTGNNSTTGPPISSDADYASLCLSLPRYDHAVPGDQGRALALRSTGPQHV